MTLPVDLVLLRHGESEGNAAKRLSEKGDDAAHRLLANRHTRSFRLSRRGRRQAAIAGQWLAAEFSQSTPPFDRYITSEYTRAMETAGLLALPGAQWFGNFYLAERDWGDLDLYSESQRQSKFAHALLMRQIEPFFWRPPNGESFADLCLRLDRVLHTLHRECSAMRVLIVCHGEVMRAFRVLLERMPQQQFKDLYFSPQSEAQIHNCEILHYTRRDPATGALANHAHWLRRIRPNQDPFWSTGWQPITRARYTNADLLNLVADSSTALE